MVKIKVFGQLAYLKQLNAPRFHKGWTIMHPLPWDEYLGGTEAGSPAQKYVWAKFAEVATNTRGLPLHQRMEIIGNELRVGKGGFASEVYGIPRDVYIEYLVEKRRKPLDVIQAEIRAWEEEARRRGAEMGAKIREFLASRGVVVR